MKKAIKLLFYLFLFQTSLFAQISIDSIYVFRGNGQIVDSVFIEGISDGQVLSKIVFIPSNDGCGTLFFNLFFNGCNINNKVPYDTIYRLGFPTEKIEFSAVWDTLSGCTFPTIPNLQDSLTWDRCYPASVHEIENETILRLHPNPTSNKIQITFEKSVNVDTIELYNINGKLVRQFNSNERTFDVQQLKSGIYFLKVESKEGLFTKKVIIQH